MKKYTICHLISSTGLYGAESVILNLIQGMTDDETFNCILGCLEDSDNKDCDLFRRAKELNLDAYQIPLKDGFNPGNIFILRRFLKEHKVDIAHSHGYKPTVLSYLAGKFVKVEQLTTCHLWTSGDRKHRLYETLEAWVIKRHKVSIAVSDRIKDEMVARGIPKEIIKVLPNGINVEEYQYIGEEKIEELRKEFNISSDTIVIGNLARLSGQKGHKFLIEAARRIINQKLNVVFLIAGEGELREELVSLTKKYGIDSRVKFLGFRKDSKDLLKLFDIFVLPSIDEGTPMALLEAMASGSAVVATKVGEIPNIIDNDIDGFLVEAGDVDDLICKLLELVQDKVKTGLFAEAAQKKIEEKYNINNVVAEYDLNYKRLIASTN